MELKGPSNQRVARNIKRIKKPRQSQGFDGSRCVAPAAFALAAILLLSPMVTPVLALPIWLLILVAVPVLMALKGVAIAAADGSAGWVASFGASATYLAAPHKAEIATPAPALS